MKKIKNYISNIIFNKPRSVNFCITYRCNNRCSYCNLHSFKTKEMKTNEIKQILNLFKKIGVRRIGFTGGEPLLREDIGDLIKYSKKLHFFTTLYSNGILVPQKIDVIKKIDILLLSLDGSKKIHNRLRGGSYEYVMKAIKTSRKNNIMTITNTVLTKINFNQIDFILKKAKQYRFQTIFQPVFSYNLSSNINNIALSSQDLKKVGIYLLQKKEEGFPVLHSKTFLRQFFIKQKKIKCWAGKAFFAIGPDGSVAPCYPLLGNTWPKYNKLFNVKNPHRQDLKKLNVICKGCFCNSHLETNLICSLNLEAILNSFIHFIPIIKKSFLNI